MFRKFLNLELVRGGSPLQEGIEIKAHWFRPPISIDCHGSTASAVCLVASRKRDDEADGEARGILQHGLFTAASFEMG